MPPVISSSGRKGLLRHVFAFGLYLPELQLSAALIFANHYLGCITALVTIVAVCFLNLTLRIAALVAYFANSAPSPSIPIRKWFMVVYCVR